MRLKITFFLILINAVLFSYIFYLESSGPGDRSEARGRMILPPGIIHQADSISLQGEQVRTGWTLTREGDRWSVKQPVAWPANPYAVRRLIDLLTYLQWDTRFPVATLPQSGKGLEDYGLQDGAAELHIRAGASEAVIRVGSSTEIGHRIYVLSPDQSEIYVVDRSLLEGINLGPDNLIDRFVVEIPAFEAESINLNIGVNNPVRVQMARVGDRWVFHAPIRAAADTQAVTASLDSLQRIEIVDFPDTSATEAGLSNPSLRLNLNGNARQQTLFLGNLVDPDAYPRVRYARLEDRTTIFTIPAEPLEPWFTAQESLRQRRFMDFNPDFVGSLEIRLDNRSITLQRLESGGWQVIQAADGNLTTRPAENALVRSLLRRMADLEAVRFVSDAPSTADLDRFGFTDPQRRVTVRLQNGETRTLLLGDVVFEDSGTTERNRLYAKRDTQPPVYLTTASILAHLPLNALHYRQRVAGSLPARATIQWIRVRDLENDTLVVELSRDPDGGWDASLQQEDHEAMAPAIRALLDAFRRFPVERFIAESFTNPLRLDSERSIPWAFALEAGIRLPGSDASPETRSYVLTERIGGMTQYGGNSSLGLSFELPQDLIDALHPILFKRQRPDADVNPEPTPPADPESVTVAPEEASEEEEAMPPTEPALDEEGL